MSVDADDLKCVAFVCEQRKGKVEPVATCFLVRLREKRPSLPTHHFFYWVTAEHVINNIRGQPILRVNRKTGVPYEWPTIKSQWRKHEDSDVAVASFDISDEFYAELDIQEVDMELFIQSDSTVGRQRTDLPLTDRPLDIQTGDELIFFGLFAQHHGADKNLPIVRLGTIARMPTSERIRIKIDNHPSYRRIIGYLAETKSWGGQSGSPAFWQKEFTLNQSRDPSGQKIKMRQKVSGLLGVVSGHFDVEQRAKRNGRPTKKITTSLNTGIAVIAPAHAIQDVILNDPDLVQEREGRLAISGQDEATASTDNGRA